MTGKHALTPEQVQVLLAAALAFERTRVSYAVVGALARNQCASPRSTQDVDFVVSAGSVDRLAGSLLRSGFATIEVSEGEVVPLAARLLERRLEAGFARLPHSRHPHFYVDLFPSHGAFGRSLLRRAVKVPVAGRRVRVATAEDYLLATGAMVRFAKRVGAPELAPKIAQWEADILAVRQSVEGRLDRAYMKRWR